MAEEREHAKPTQQAGQQVSKNDDDVEGHGNVPLLDDKDPELAKLKLANDEDDDVEGHANNPAQTP